MGKVVSRIWTERSLRGGGASAFGTPKPIDSLQMLVNWSRESLMVVVEHFRTTSNASLTLDFNNFSRILQFESLSAAEEAFNVLKLPKKDRVDFLSIIGAMVAASNQRFISKVSFLFSVYDLDSSGSINRAEFFIAARSLFMGIGRFFMHVEVPTPKQLEEVTNEVFDRIDDDGSGLIMLGELLTFAYRSKDLKALLAPFPAEDTRVFEELVIFAAVSQRMAKAGQDAMKSVDEKLRYKLSITPDPRKRIAQGGVTAPKEKIFRDDQRMWKQPKSVSKAQTWVMWRVYKSLAGENEQVLASLDLRAVLADNGFLDKLLDNIANLAAELISSNVEAGTNVEDDKAAVKKLVAHLQKSLQDPQAISRLDVMGEGSISLRAFYCVILHHVPESEIESCLTWCKKFVAHQLLSDILKDPDQMKVEWEDLQALFRIIDTDGDGSVTMDELCNDGLLKKEECEKLMVDWDKDGSGHLTDSEIKSMLVKMDCTLDSGLRTALRRCK